MKSEREKPGKTIVAGAGDYEFQIWAGDSEPDTFRIKIWSEDEASVETVLYDNVSDQATDQAIGGGSIVVHSQGK